MLVGVSGQAWLVCLDRSGVAVAATDRAVPDVQASVTGAAPDLLRWLWGRADDDLVRVVGDPDPVNRLRSALKVATE